MILYSTSLHRLLAILLLSILLTHIGLAQRRNVALDSMGMNMGRQNWKAAIDWALKAAEFDPTEKNWRYLNAAIFASNDKNKELALHYAGLVIDSEIAINARFGESFEWLENDPQWRQLKKKVANLEEQQRQERIKASLPFRSYQQDLLTQTAQYVDSLTKISSPEKLYQQIRETRPVHNYTRNGQYIYAWQKLADSLEFPYLIQLPPNFDQKKPYPLIVVLHGAVGQQTKTSDVADSTTAARFGRLFVRESSSAGYIAVFPSSTRYHNWMMPDDGFELVPEIVKQVKKMYPVDDSRVYVTGHSNGATGAFSYLMKQPGLFAGFSGINNRPQVRTGGTFFRNGLNRSFYNVATDYDYYYPSEGHKALTEVAKKIGIDWQNREIAGHLSHGYLINKTDSITQDVYHQLFTYIPTKQRNPFQKRLYWECDDIKHGRADWLEIVQLDTLKDRASWQIPVNLEVKGWRGNADPEVLLDSTSMAFVFPRQSGAVQANFTENLFELKTSRVGKVRIYLSPEMVDFKKPLKVIVNGKNVFDGAIQMDRSFILNQYKREMDHQAVWANSLELSVP